MCLTSNHTFLVEIDTLWNVKEMAFYTSLSTRGVEIDTLWNVKECDMSGAYTITRRNRYIVECKVILAKIALAA